jgi:predicted metal-dependent hydrolase
MTATIHLGKIPVDVVLKDIKNIHLSVHPPTGKVRIAAPARMSVDRIRLFAISKLDWIKEQQRKLREQERESPREFLDRESHYVWGRRYLLEVVEADAAPVIELKHRKILLRIRPSTDEARRQDILDHWYRDQVRAAAQPLIAKWEPLLGVHAEGFIVSRMKTKWGSCSPGRKTIRLNTELAKKPPACLEYIVVHEMVHMLEPTHNAKFVALMDRFLPRWGLSRQTLNQLPVRHENWRY